MPTTRTRKMRTRANKRHTIPNWLHWCDTIVMCIEPPGHPNNPWESEDEVKVFYEAHKDEILSAVSERNRERKQPFRRPDQYLEELEEKHPRKRTGYEVWTGPWTGSGPGKERRDPIYETDEKYLTRLNLLFNWEKELHQ